MSSQSSLSAQDLATTEQSPAMQERRSLLDEQEAALLRMLDTMTSPEFFGPFSYLRQPLVDLLSALRHLRDYRAAHPGEDAQMLNFDDAKEPMFDRLGLSVKTVQWQESHYQKINEGLTKSGMKQRISNFWDNRYFLTHDDLEVYQVMMSQNGGTPPLVRMIFFRLQILYQEELDLEPLVLSEMNFNVEPSNPLVVSYTPEAGLTHTTLLRGSTKMAYVFFAQESGSSFRQGQTREENRQLLAINPLNLEELVEDPPYLGLFNDDCFLVFSVYDKPISGKIAPTITQCLAIMQKTNKKKISWCLTTGREWIFGVLVDGHSSICHLTDIISLDKGTDLDNVFLTLVFWGMAPYQEIVNLFS